MLLLTGTAIRAPLFRARKNSSRPSPRHRGKSPPSVGTCHLLPDCVNDATWISLRPYSLDVYATHFPSGENWAFPLLNGVCNQEVGLRSPDIGKRQKLIGLPPLSSSVAPSGDHAFGLTAVSAIVTNSSGPYAARGFQVHAPRERTF